MICPAVHFSFFGKCPQILPQIKGRKLKLTQLRKASLSRNGGSIVYSDAYITCWRYIIIGSITRIPSIVLIFFLSLCGRRLKGNGRGNSGVRDYGGRKGNSLVLSRARIPSSLSPAWQALKGGREGEILACEITGGERELPRSFACPHSLFPFAFPPGFSSKCPISFLGCLWHA